MGAHGTEAAAELTQMADPGPQPLNPRKGAKTKLLGVVLLILATLDVMLSWRGGFVPGGVIPVLFVGGVVLFVIGAVRQAD
ncbi:MAG TPA: hypothetical protein DES72_13960 [Gammaproteobacteria bacterium]|nr:hypothetical protein [Gammaproteobacteria bacterium]